MVSLRQLPTLFKDAGESFLEDKAPRLGAAISFYTMFSLAPLLVIAVAVASFLFGHERARGEIADQFGMLVGPDGARAVRAILIAADKPRTGLFATILGLVTLAIGATGVFGSLQDALNTIWGVSPKPNRGIMGIVRDRILSFAMLSCVCFLLLVSLIVSTGLAAAGTWLSHSAPSLHFFWEALNFFVSMAVIAVLFATVFKILPDVDLTYRQVFTGSIVTASLFVIGKWGVGVYLGKASIGSAYGAAGSLVVLLIWIYYSAQILLFGAELTKIYVEHFGSHPRVSANAVPITREMRAEEGIPTEQELERAQVDENRARLGLQADGPRYEIPGEPSAQGTGGFAAAALLIAALGGFLLARVVSRSPRSQARPISRIARWLHLHPDR